MELGEGVGEGMALAVSVGVVDGEGELLGDPPLSPTTRGVGEGDGDAEGLLAVTGAEAAPPGEAGVGATATRPCCTATPGEACGESREAVTSWLDRWCANWVERSTV